MPIVFRAIYRENVMVGVVIYLRLKICINIEKQLWFVILSIYSQLFTSSYWKAREFHMKKEVCIPGLQAGFSLWLFPDCLLHYLFYRLDLATLQTLCDPHTRQSYQLNRIKVSQTSKGTRFIKCTVFIGLFIFNDIFNIVKSYQFLFTWVISN